MFTNQNPKIVKMDLVYALNERVFRLMYILEKGFVKALGQNLRILVVLEPGSANCFCYDAGKTT